MGKHGAMLLGGHRGMGENLATTGTDGSFGVYPAYRENTIQSFQQAFKCGVGFVEFDVQVTRDNIPIIWHDDDVVFGTLDHPRKPQVKDLTLAELQTLCGRGSKYLPAGAAGAAASSYSDDLRGGSDDGSSDDCCAEPPRGLLRLFRDKRTRQRTTRYALWSCDADDAIPTLEAVFASLPLEVGFDIEVKMTTGDEVVHTPAEEVDRMLRAILPVVDRCATAATASSTTSTPRSAGGSPRPAAPGAEDQHPADQHARRSIMFSSFDPDVCVELKRRQTQHPVYYLSGCGLYEHADARRTSVPAALAFATEAGMKGVVVPASVLLKNMEMVADAGSLELELMTYGLENNDLACLRTQADAGVAAAIVDEVAGVTAALGGGGDLPTAAEAKERRMEEEEAGHLAA